MMPYAGKKFEDMVTRFDRIYERDRQTDGRTDGRTPHDGIASRGKNVPHTRHNMTPGSFDMSVRHLDVSSDISGSVIQTVICAGVSLNYGDDDDDDDDE